MNTDLLKCFLYLLLRDKLSAGVVEALVQESEKSDPSPFSMITYSNQHLAAYAGELVNRLVR